MYQIKYTHDNNVTHNICKILANSQYHAIELAKTKFNMHSYNGFKGKWSAIKVKI